MKSLKKVFGSPSLSKDNDAQPNTKSSSNQPLSQPNLNPGYYGEFPDSFSITYICPSQLRKERPKRLTTFFSCSKATGRSSR